MARSDMETPDFLGSNPHKDIQTVTPEGNHLRQMIDGVQVRRAPVIEDERGELCEVFRESWGVHPLPLVYVYYIGIRPRKIKGWVVHKKQDDRLFVARGVIRFGLYDDRRDSKTYKLLNVFTVSERNRGLVVIPRGVYHGIQNIGETEASLVNMPTEPYNHADPDKYRLPLKNDLIPFAFEDVDGW